MGSPPLPAALPMVESDNSQTSAMEMPRSPSVIHPPFQRPFPFKSVRAGAWLVSYRPVNSAVVVFDGTIRVERFFNGRTASGDLYQRPVVMLPNIPPIPSRPSLLPPPDPANGIPIQRRSRYRYYLRVTKILEDFTFGNSVELGLQMWRFNNADNTFNTTPEGDFTANMTWIAAPGGYPSASDYLEGDVKDATGAIVARLKMGWVSPSYRKATIELDTVSGSERPLDSGTGHNWQTVFTTLGWDVTVVTSEDNIPEPSGDSWADAELHAAMLARRDKNDLDAEWRYHILAVKQLDATPRGIMYDVGATDSDNVPREGVGISSHWIFPPTDDPDWGLVKGMRFGTALAPYFRTAVHELGHAFGLFHNSVDNGYMNTSDTIARAGTPATPFPNNVKWDYAEDDLKRLRHYPDVFVRPGGAPFGLASETTPQITPTDREIEVPNLMLEVSALLSEVPLGAPVRVTITLTNNGVVPLRTPADISLKYGFVHGIVKDTLGRSRSFKPLVLCVDDLPMTDLAGGESVTASLTLFRGAKGALFPTSGIWEINATVSWSVGDGVAAVTGKTTVLVTGPHTAAHAAAAHKILTTPDAHLVLVLGGDHLSEGMGAIEQAVKDETLRPHFAAIEARRLAQRFMERAADVKKASELVEKDDVVMSASEVSKLAKLFRATESGHNGVRRILELRDSPILVSGALSLPK